ncbi:MAG: NAD-dependent deacetylase [Candidatus Thorarchaeota archaeon]
MVFTGAGISTESGLSDFRGKDGIWTRRDKGLPPKKSKHFDEVDPNSAHLALVELQNLGVMKFLISQNVDNLHLKSGIKPEILAELHGNYTIMKCLDCDSRFRRNELGWDRETHGRGSRSESVTPNQPVCKNCQGRIISSVVNFNEPMPDKEVRISKEHSLKCDLMLVIGSSLSVFPAANLPKIAKQQGAKLIILNYDPTGLDSIADLKLKVKVGEFLPVVIEEVKNLLASS